MHILALEPFYGGSHRAFLDGWKTQSRHHLTILGLPPRAWKWRMRHAAVTMAETTREQLRQGLQFDALFCSDMLNLAEFRGLCDPEISRLPAVAYFHENQLTYPVRVEAERDLHFAYTNFTTCLAADAVWFTAFHCDAFLTALEIALRRMPDYQAVDNVAAIRRKSTVHPPGINAFPAKSARKPGPLRVLWAARWEHDKNPEDFFAALDRLIGRGVEFRVSVIGEQFRKVPAVFNEYQRKLAHRIDRWGFQPTRGSYCDVLAEADVCAARVFRHCGRGSDGGGLLSVSAAAVGVSRVVERRVRRRSLSI